MRAPYSPLPDHGASPSLPVLRTSPAATPPATTDPAVAVAATAAVTATGTLTAHDGSPGGRTPPSAATPPLPAVRQPQNLSGTPAGFFGSPSALSAESKGNPSPGPTPPQHQRPSLTLGTPSAPLQSRGSSSVGGSFSLAAGGIPATGGERIDVPAVIRRPTVPRSRFPCSVVWTPIPLITWILPFVGHMGICDSRGVIHDFAGPYFIGVDDMAFGEPTRYLPLGDLLFPPPVFRRLMPRQLQQALASMAGTDGGNAGGGPAGGVDTTHDVEAAYSVDMAWLRGGASAGGAEGGPTKSSQTGARRVALEFDSLHPKDSHELESEDTLTELAAAPGGPLATSAGVDDTARPSRHAAGGNYDAEDSDADAALRATLLAGGIQTAQQRLRAFDRAIATVSEHFRRTQMYNFFCNNCHSFVATCLLAADVPRAAPGGFCGSRNDTAACTCFVRRSGASAAAAGGTGAVTPAPACNASAAACGTAAAAVAAARKRSGSMQAGAGGHQDSATGTSLSTELALTIAGGRYCCCGCAAYAPPSTWNMVWLGAYVFLFGRWVSLRRMVVTLLPFTLIVVAVVLMATLIPHK